MLKKIATIAVVVFVSACIDDGVEGSQGPLPVDKTPGDPSDNMPVGTTSTALAVRDHQARPDGPGGLCDLLPQDGSACAHACDESALLAFIPEGTCATFSCPLTDGSTFVTGGCN
jgi:hypothetical protein